MSRDETSEGTAIPRRGPSPEVTRRTALVGAAWALPVVAVATAAPLAAASAAAEGRFVIETTTGGSWVTPDYYALSVQLRNDDTQAATLPVAEITTGVLTVTFPREAVGAIQPAVIGNAGGDTPTTPLLPPTDPTWTAGSAVENDDGTVTYTLLYSGSVAGQGVTRVTFGVLGSTPLSTNVPLTLTSTGSPTDGTVTTRTFTLF